jgi:hypothetical protein
VKVIAAVAFAALACSGKSSQKEPPPTAVSEVVAPEPERSIGACGDASRREVLAGGLELLTLVPDRPAAVATADRCLRVLRADPARFEIAVGSGEEITAPRWAAARGAVAVTNASMFHAGGASTGLLVAGGRVLAPSVNDKFGAFLAADPRRPGAAPVRMWGRGCPGGSIDGLRRDYRTVVQNYRLLDCDGAAIAWKDPKIYSAAAVGLDRAGRILFIHVRAPYVMADFTALLAGPGAGLDLAAAMYVEGGPEATLFVDAGDRSGLWVGSFETHFLESDSNAVAWPLPNVLMLRPRTDRASP